MKRLIVVRHGYTFEENEEPRRVGRQTNLPLVERGKNKIKILANYLMRFEVSKILSSNLKRTIESATIIKNTLSHKDHIVIEDGLLEIDYGPDENVPESAVISRLGQEMIDQWEQKSILPQSWVLNIEEVKNMWKRVANSIGEGETIIAVTSAGIAKFSPIALIHDSIDPNSNFKINPGCSSIFEYDNKNWKIAKWNYFPSQEK